MTIHKKGDINVILNGNVMINGSTTYGLKLMEGIREFDVIMISASDINGAIINQLLTTMTNDGTLIMKVDLSHPIMLENMMKLQNLYAVGTFIEEEQTWIAFRRGKAGKERELSLSRLIRSGQSILNVNILLEQTVKTIFLCNYEDQSNRTFVIMHEGVDENMFENIRKQAFIYETKLERIVLDEKPAKTVA